MLEELKAAFMRGFNKVDKSKKLEKPKSRLISVFVNGISPDHERVFSHIIFIPPGWKFIRGFAEKDRLVREDGLVMKMYDWPPGMFLEFQFKYEDEETF